MKLILCLIYFLFFSSTVDAASIAVEFQEDHKFAGVIRKAYVTESTIEIVTFAVDRDRIVPFAWVYEIIEKKLLGEKRFRVKCINQLGITTLGVLDISDQLTPKISMKTNNGVIITNLSKLGLEMKKKYIPHIDLGS
ncbi:MAG: hypothetical protein AB7D06_14945 [Pedobacter sp.]